MRFTADRPYSDPETAARKLLEIGQHRGGCAGRPDPYREDQRAISVSGARNGAGLKLAIERGWLVLHDSGTYLNCTQAGRGSIRLKSEQLRFRHHL